MNYLKRALGLIVLSGAVLFSSGCSFRMDQNRDASTGTGLYSAESQEEISGAKTGQSGKTTRTVSSSQEESEDEADFRVKTQKKTEFVILRQGSTESLDPVLAEDSASTKLFASFMEGLVITDRKGGIVPGMAKSWDISEDGLTWTFHLIPDSRFSDGSLITIDDWIFTFQRAKEAAQSDWRAAAESIDSVEGSGNDLVLHLKQKDPELLSHLTMYNLCVQSKAHFELKWGGKYNSEWPVSCGKYYVESWDRSSGEIVFVKNDYYRNKDRVQNTKIILRTIREDYLRELMMLSGMADLALDIPLSRLASLRQQQGIFVSMFPSTSCRYLVLNEEANDAFANKNVRYALVLGTDFRKIVANCLGGYGQVSSSYISPYQNYYSDDLPKIEYDPSEARRILSEEGYREGFVVNLYLRSGNALFEQIGVEIKNQWAEIGVKVNLITMDEETLLSQQKKMALDLVIGSWVDDAPDPSILTSYICDPSVSNGFYTGWRNDEAEKLSHEISADVDEEERRNLYNKLQKIVCEDYVLPTLFSSWESAVQRMNVIGFSQSLYGSYQFEEMHAINLK